MLFIRMPVGVAMMRIGTWGIWMVRPRAAMPKLAGEIFNEASNYPLTIIPLFVLTGNLAGVSGMSRDLYDAAHSRLGLFKGGLASATVVGCAGFSALSVFSLAAVLTTGRVALPEMQRYRYADGLAAGSVAAGATVGMLIPPSAGFVIFTILTEESIGRLFMAGVLPGLLLTLCFILAIWILVWRNPDAAPANALAVPLPERLLAMGRAGCITGIALLTIGGIYSGVSSVVEAAGIGAALALVLTAIRLKLPAANLQEVFAKTVKSSGTVFLILFGAFVFKSFIGFSGITHALSLWVEGLGLSGTQVEVAFPHLFIVLGVLMVIALEMGLISPPDGVNVFVVKGIAPGAPLGTIFRGIWPFWFTMLAAMIIVLLVPWIALLLPNTMFG